MENPKIVLLYPTQQPSLQSTFSVPRLVAQLYQTLLQAGYNVLLITRPGEDASDSNPSIKIINHVSKWRLRCQKIFRQKPVLSVDQRVFFKQAIRIIRKQGFEDALFVTAHPSGAIALARAFTPSQVFFWIHNYPTTEAQLSKFKEALTMPIHVVVPSKALYLFIWQRLQANKLPFNLHILPYHINEQASIAAQPTADEQLVVFHGSGLAPHKGLAILLNVLKMFSANMTKRIELRYIGKVNRQYHINGVKITELPRMSPTDLMQAIAHADVGIIPSLWFENAPVLLVEYLQGGAIPLVSASGGMPDMVAGYHARVVPHPNELLAWKTALEEIAAMPAEKRWQLRIENQQRFVQQHEGFNQKVTEGWKEAFHTAM
jgi:glycosyltransferase involved in cell wall biosynthesis